MSTALQLLDEKATPWVKELRSQWEHRCMACPDLRNEPRLAWSLANRRLRLDELVDCSMRCTDRRALEQLLS